MPDCPRCHQPIATQALTCPYCHTPLKAYGHPGMPLYRAAGTEPLCLSCTYHEDDTCNYPKRPTAMDCIMYRDRNQPALPTPGPNPYPVSLFSKTWFRRNLVWFALLGLVLVSFLIVLLQ